MQRCLQRAKSSLQVVPFLVAYGMSLTWPQVNLVDQVAGLISQVLYLCSTRCFHLRVEQNENAQKKTSEICLLWQAMNIEGNIQCFLIQGGLHDYEYDKHKYLNN